MSSVQVVLAVVAMGAFACLVSSETITFETMNLGLVEADFVPFYALRKMHVVEELLKSDADVLCLQEVWEDPDQRMIAAGLREKFPHIHTKVDLNGPSTSRAPVCSPSQGEALAAVSACVTEKCDTTQPTGIVFGCIFARCFAEFYPLYRTDCHNCLSSNLPRGVGEAGQICMTDTSRRYDSTFGVMLLSKRPMSQLSYEEIPAALLRRGFLQANIEGVGKVTCTHISAALPSLPYTKGSPIGQYDGWEDENKEHIKLIDKAIGSRGILLGDLNMGPAFPSLGLQGELANNWPVIESLGYVSGYVKSGNVQCSWCYQENFLVSVTGDVSTILIDHVLTKNRHSLKYVSSKIVHNMPVTTVPGFGIPITLSDHFGLSSTYEIDSTGHGQWMEAMDEWKESFAAWKAETAACGK